MEIHEWFEERIGISDQEELGHVERQLGNDPRDHSDEAITVSDLLAIDNIYVPFMARTKKVSHSAYLRSDGCHWTVVGSSENGGSVI